VILGAITIFAILSWYFVFRRLKWFCARNRSYKGCMQLNNHPKPTGSMVGDGSGALVYFPSTNPKHRLHAAVGFGWVVQLHATLVRSVPLRNHLSSGTKVPAENREYRDCTQKSPPPRGGYIFSNTTTSCKDGHTKLKCLSGKLGRKMERLAPTNQFRN